jgi:P4 family phage/plasmid primase-like protien
MSSTNSQLASAPTSAAIDFIKLLFEPGDLLCFGFLDTNKKWQQAFRTYEVATQPEFIEKLQASNESGNNIYIAMNTYQSGSRTEKNLAAVRTVWAEIDENGRENLDKVFASTLVPEPTVVTQTSPGKFHAIWKVNDVPVADAKVFLKAICTEFNADSNAIDGARVLRLPGFKNCKYEDKPEVKVLHLSSNTSRHALSEFKLVADVAAPAPEERTPVDITPEGPPIDRGTHDATLHSIAGKLRSMCWEQPEIEERLMEIAGKRLVNPGSDWPDMVKKHAKNIVKKPAGQPVTVTIGGVLPGAATPVPAPPRLPVHNTELGNAQRFAAAQADIARYAYASKGWFVWTSKVWQEDDGSLVARAMKSISKTIVAEAAQITDEEKNKAHHKWGLRSESRATIANSLFLAQSEEGLTIKLERFDDEATDFKFNTIGKTLDLQDNRSYDPLREDYITKTSPAVYDKEAKCPRFISFLEEVLPDPEVRAYIQRAAGLSLTGFTGEHALFLLYGTGRNGKSSLVDTLRYVLGDYATQSDWSSFTESKNGGGGVNNDIARLRGARFVSASESAANAKMAEGTIKNVTGGEAIQARFLYQEFFEFVPKFKLWLTTNHKPRIVGTDPAIWSRVNLINFGVQVPVEKRDKQLGQKLRAEASGILNWMLEGYRMWEQQGLNPPEAVKAATEQYRQDSDTISRFIDDKCSVSAQPGDEDFTVPVARLYDEYKRWIDESGEMFTLTIKQFKDALESRGFVYKRTMTERRWVGISLNFQSCPPSASPAGHKASDDQELPF